MRKFIYTIILVGAFQFAQGQQVVDFIYQYGSNYYYLTDSTEFSNTNISLPMIIDVKNTNSQDLLQGDTIAIVFALNDSLFKSSYWVLNKTWSKDSLILLDIGTVSLPSKFLKSGNNMICAVVAYVTVNKVRESVMKVTCKGFKIKATNVADIDIFESVKLYPNPVRGNLKIENLNEATDISIYNIMGQEVQKVSSAMGSVEIDMSGLSNGLYFVKMQNGKNIRTEKIQVVK